MDIDDRLVRIRPPEGLAWPMGRWTSPTAERGSAHGQLAMSRWIAGPRSPPGLGPPTAGRGSVDGYLDVVDRRPGIGPPRTEDRPTGSWTSATAGCGSAHGEPRIRRWMAGHRRSPEMDRATDTWTPAIPGDGSTELPVPIDRPASAGALRGMSALDPGEIAGFPVAGERPIRGPRAGAPRGGAHGARGAAGRRPDDNRSGIAFR